MPWVSRATRPGEIEPKGIGMIRNFKALGLAVVAVLAMSAFVASAAHAVTGSLQVHPDNGTTTIHATQIGTHVFELTDNSNLQTTCTTATFQSTPGNTVKTGDKAVTVQPIYQGCTAFGLSSTINTSACHYLIHTDNGTVDVECGTGAVVITTLTCELKVDSQAGLSELTATNAGTNTTTGMDIALHADVEGIDYTVTKDGIGCPLSKVGTFFQGDYRGTTTVKGHNSAGTPVGLTIK